MGDLCSVVCAVRAASDVFLLNNDRGTCSSQKFASNVVAFYNVQSLTGGSLSKDTLKQL